MDSDSEKENYFSLFMKRKKKDCKKKENYGSNKKLKNDSSSLQKIKVDNKNKLKLLLESSEKKNKSTFSFIKSYLFNFQDQDKKSPFSGVKNIVIDKQKVKNVRVNKSSTDINRKGNINKRNSKMLEYEKNENKLSINNKKKKTPTTHNTNNNIINNNYDNKIDKLKNRIFNLINIIDDFEKDYIKSSKPIQIKDQLNQINLNMNVISNNLQLNKANKKKMDNINGILYVTDRKNYDQNKNVKNNRKDFMRLNEDLDICNYYDYDYSNKILTKRINSNKKKKPRAISSRIIDKNKTIIMINYKQNNNININNSNSTFMKIISSNSNSNKELKKKINNNISISNKNNKSQNIYNKFSSNSSSNKTLYSNMKNKSQKESYIFQRKINYSNFINQKMKNNIIHRNKETSLKRNKINKSRYSYNNCYNYNGCTMPIDINNRNNCIELFIGNNKSNSIDKKKTKLKNLI